jgi:trehalose 6-phosphate phosphatase
MPNAESRAEAEASATGRELMPPPLRFDRLALFLDMDGVLAPMAPTPDAVRATPRRTAILRRLAGRLDGRLAIVSGRTLAEIDRISGEASLAASGVHGLERRRADGSMDTVAAAPGVRSAIEALLGFQSNHPGVLVEDKGVSVGLHYRQAPDVHDAAMAFARSVAAEAGLVMQPGIMVVELKTPGSDKGSAITAFMAEAPFRGATPVMFGDDLTDEDAFRAAEHLGGFGVLVGPVRKTAATFRLDGVGQVLDWLEALADTADSNDEAAA